ncbi:Hsp70 family protein, partial [Saccharomonospora iraqiensis]|uniref:Hsp70 family protein n=1 Tax=Saccharomonospora iraqiensis TaxID=52698 RepID=UPI00022DF150
MGILSVDLGTSNTVAVLSVPGRATRVVEVDGSATMPSAVFAEEGGELLVGRDAERRARLDPTRFEPNPKRRVDEQALELGTDSVPVDEALAAVLRRVYDETVRQLGGTPPEQIRLTHPAEWGPRRREVLLAAARGAGMDADDRTVTLVPEPVAAAAHFASFPGKSLEPGRTLAVYDLGAGTFDVAVLGATPTGFTVLAEEGLPDLGGLDVDRALLEHVGRAVSHSDPQRWQRLLRPESTTDRRARRTLLEDVKAAKEALSRLPRTEVPMPEPFTDVVVTRSELEALVRPTMLRSVELLEATVRAAGVEPGLLADIYLVGGSSRLPLVGDLIEDKLGVSPSSLDQPETAVAFGAHHVGPDGRTTGTEQVDGATLGAAGATSPAFPPVGPTGQGPRSPHTSGPHPP